MASSISKDWVGTVKLRVKVIMMLTLMDDDFVLNPL